MKRGPSILVLCFMIPLIAIGCGKDQEPEIQEPGGSDPEVSVSPQETDAAGSEMVVRVGDTPILRAKVDRKTHDILQQFKMKSPQADLEQMRPLAFRQAIENLIDQQLLLQEASGRGFQADPEEYPNQFSMMKGRFASPEKFTEQLAAMGLTEELFRREIRENIIIDILLDQEIGHDQEVGIEEIKAYYRDNPDDFKRPFQVRASHIILKVNKEHTGEEKAAMRQKLLDLKKQIEAGADFAPLAAEHSEGPSKTKGGDLGYFGKGQMVKAFENAAFSMQVGELSDIIVTKFGYHLILLTERQEEETVGLEQVEKSVRNLLKNQKKQEAVANYLQNLRGQVDFEYAEGYEPPEDTPSEDNP